MNPIELEVVFLDGSKKQVSAVAADLIAFESHFDLSITSLEKDLRLTHLLFIAWNVLKRTGQTSDEFDVWANGVAGVSQASGK